jgi:hypothetical protein
VGANPGPCSSDAPRPYEWALCAPLLVFPIISRGERPLSVKEGSMGEKWLFQFCRQHVTSMVSVGIFYMLQIYDMGLPVRRKAC